MPLTEGTNAISTVGRSGSQRLRLDTGVLLDQTGHTRQDSPPTLETWQPDGWPDLEEDQLGWDQEERVPDPVRAEQRDSVSGSQDRRLTDTGWTGTEGTYVSM